MLTRAVACILLLAGGWVCGRITRPAPEVHVVKPVPKVAAAAKAPAKPEPAKASAPAPAQGSDVPEAKPASAPAPASRITLSDAAKTLAGQKDLSKNTLNVATAISDALQPDEATERWIASLTDPVQRETAALAYALKFATTHRDRSQRMADLVSTPSMQRKLSSAITGQMVMSSPEAALNYANALPDDTSRRAARMTLISVMAKLDSERLLRALTASDAGWSKDELQNATLYLASSQGPRMAELALQMEDKSTRDLWMQRSIYAWTRKDPEAASSWVAQLPPGNDRDQAISQMVSASANEDPVSSLNWAMTIGDKNKWEHSVENSFRLWLKQSPAAAEAWAAQQQGEALLKVLNDAREKVRHPGGWNASYQDGMTIYESH